MRLFGPTGISRVSLGVPVVVAEQQAETAVRIREPALVGRGDARRRARAADRAAASPAARRRRVPNRRPRRRRAPRSTRVFPAVTKVLILGMFSLLKSRRPVTTRDHCRRGGAPAAAETAVAAVRRADLLLRSAAKPADPEQAGGAERDRQADHGGQGAELDLRKGRTGWNQAGCEKQRERERRSTSQSPPPTGRAIRPGAAGAGRRRPPGRPRRGCRAAGRPARPSMIAHVPVS